MPYRNRLEIGLWVSPPASEATEARYAEIREAGFTFVIGLTEYGEGGGEAIGRALDAAAANGLGYIVHDPELKRLEPREASEDELRRRVAPFAGHPAYRGHLLKDEPSAPEIDDLAFVKELYLRAAPEGLAYVNLFPRHAAPELLQADYAEYVEKFMRVYKPQVLSYDHYPFLDAGNTHFAGDRITEDYYANLETIRDASVRYDTPFWLFVQTLAFNGTHRDPTEAEIRWQVNTSLAFGAKGIQYFTYWTPEDGREKFGDAIIGRDGKRTRHYGEAREINRELAALGPELASLKSAGVLFGGEHPVAAVDSIDGFPPLEAIEGDAVVIGCFTDPDGLPALFVANGSYEDEAETTLVLTGDSCRRAEIVGARSRNASELSGVSRLRLSLAPGEGKLVRFAR